MVFNTGLDKALLKLFVLIKKILKGNNMTTVQKMNATMKNILSGEVLRFFEQKSQESGNKKTKNYKWVVKGMTTHFFPPN